jgi:putative transposase
MKGKRFTTEEKIRILQDAATSKSIVELCQEKNISEATLHRWKKRFGRMDLNEAKRLKELEREDSRLEKILAEALLAKRVQEYVVGKNYEPGAQGADGDGRRNRRAAGSCGYRGRTSGSKAGNGATGSSRWWHACTRSLRHTLRYGYRRIAALLRREG